MKLDVVAVAAGMLHFALRRAENVHWQALDVGREMHARLKGGIFGSVLGTPRVRHEERDARERALELLDPRQARVVELRFFGGLTIEESAEVLGVSPITVRRDWMTARQWLHREMGN